MQPIIDKTVVVKCNSCIEEFIFNQMKNRAGNNSF
jgi:hypothetical protein